MSPFWFPILNPQLITYHSNIGLRFIAMLDLGKSTLLHFTFRLDVILFFMRNLFQAFNTLLIILVISGLAISPIQAILLSDVVSVRREWLAKR